VVVRDIKGLDLSDYLSREMEHKKEDTGRARSLQKGWGVGDNQSLDKKSLSTFSFQVIKDCLCVNNIC
jgi:hypothetical protein